MHLFNSFCLQPDWQPIDWLKLIILIDHCVCAPMRRLTDASRRGGGGSWEACIMLLAMVIQLRHTGAEKINKHTEGSTLDESHVFRIFISHKSLALLSFMPMYLTQYEVQKEANNVLKWCNIIIFVPSLLSSTPDIIKYKATESCQESCFC